MNIVKLLLMMCFMGAVQVLSAQEIDVEINPTEPLVNENFFVTFKIKTSGNVEPYISFTPSGATVQGKSEQGVSISTTVINGKFTTNREQNYVYELVAERAGYIFLKNIKVEINGKVTNLKDINVNVLSQARKIQDAFMEAQASKTKVYIGEGIDVNYYLYFKTSISANDVKEFPKLNKFIKRFHHINSPVETVQYKGQLFKRILTYSARLYPEKVGAAVLDPMIISVQIMESDYSSPFGGFGMGGARYKNKDLASPRIEIQVLPLPAENVPTGFTGLVGEHDFSLSIPKNKYLVNEPIEFKLEVKGKGAVENMDAPAIYTDNNLEAFDTKSEVVEMGNQAAKKVFEYTMLARGPLNLSQRELSLAYFDPGTGRYVEKKMSIPSLEVSGVAAPTTGSGSSVAKRDEEVAKQGDDFLSKLFASNGGEKAVIKNQLGLVGPNLSMGERWPGRWIDLFNMALFLFVLVFSGYWISQSRGGQKATDNNAFARKLISKMRSKGLNYSDLYNVLVLLDEENKMTQGGVSLKQILDESLMSLEAKNYFLETLKVCEEKSFGINKQDQKINFERKHFHELLKNI